MEYPTFIKMTNDYIMYKYRGSGTLEISDLGSSFTKLYMGYGRQEAVRLFREQRKEYLGGNS